MQAEVDTRQAEVMGRMHKRRTRLSFRYKLIWSSIACILIPAFLSLALSNYLTQDAVKEQAQDNAMQSLRLAEGYVSNLLNNMTYIANYIQVLDSNMRTILQRRAAETPPEPFTPADYNQFTDTKTIIDKLDNISIIGEEVLVTILLSNRSYYANYSRDDYDPMRIFDAPWFSELQDIYGLESKWIGSRSYPRTREQTDESGYITLGRTLRYANRNIYGYVVVTIREEQIRKIFERIASGQEMMLLNEHGVIISHRDHERIGEIFDRKATGLTTDAGGGADSYLLSELPLSAVSGWSLVSITPYEDAVSPINRIYNRVLVIQLISFFLFLLLLIYLLQKFTKPLVRLGKLAETVQRGNLEVRSRIRGDDEIGRLGYSFDQMLDRIKDMIREVQLGEMRKREAELAMLQAQINPHFVFNVLNSIRMKMLRKGDSENAEMISAMSRLMRMSIGSHHDTITLHEEIGIVIDYVKLMNLRQKENVELEIRADSETYLEEVPRFVLQPIIENSIIHGLGQQAGRIVIEARSKPQALIVTVEDNGQGMERSKLEEVRANLTADHVSGQVRSSNRLSGIGLRNVVERMRLKFGQSFVLRIDSEPGSGTRIELHIPRFKEGVHHVQSHYGG
jgi:two-component system sensor histidine kinase YesM